MISPILNHAQYWHLLNQYLRTQKHQVAILTILLFTSIGLQLINPQIVRNFIDTAQAGGSTRQLTMVALLFFGIALVNQAVAVGTGYLSEAIGWTATNDLRADLADHCLRLDMGFHNTHTPGEMIERIDGDIEILANFFSQLVIYVLGSGLLIIGVLAVLLAEDWRVGAILTAFVLLVLIYMRYTLPLVVPYAEATRVAKAEVTSFLEERLAGTEDITANGAQDYVISGLYPLFRETWLTQRKVSVLWVVISGSHNVLMIAFNALGLGLGAFLFQRDLITLGTVYLIFHYTNLLFMPLYQMFLQGNDLQRATASINRVQDLRLRRRETRRGEEVTISEHSSPPRVINSSHHFAPEVQFQTVSFAYEPNQAILNDLTFTLKPQKVLGLLGRTGSGKTTIARLLLGLYRPTRGHIRLNGADISNIALSELRDHIGMVTQDVQLFRASVRDNLTFFNPEIGDDPIWQALDALDLTAWVRSLPHGLDTMLSSDSGGLSAGEAQLLAFARIFLKNPRLIILDEASSRLDPATEQHIERAVDKLLQGRTAIIIAHRLSTVQRADQIMVLSDGQILEHGDRVELAQDEGSAFYRLLQTGLDAPDNSVPDNNIEAAVA